MDSQAFTLSVDAVTVRRGDQTLFDPLSFSLTPGQAALVLGPNGAGKTSLLRVIAGLSFADTGTVLWNGRKIRALDDEQRPQIAYRGHFEALKKDLTVAENLDFFCALWQCPTPPEQLLEAVGLAQMPQRRVRQLSAGQKRRLALAALRAQQARLWILDEPMTNLDRAGQALVVDWLRAHLDSGGAALIATHQSEALTALASFAIEFE